MDPNEALRRIREAASNAQIAPDEATLRSDVEDLIAHFEALDEWLYKGGFLPAAWAIPGERG